MKVVPESQPECRTEADGGSEKDGVFSIGHVNAGYLAAIGLVYAIPQRYKEMLTRAPSLAKTKIK